MEYEEIIGIDLGTTNSLITIWRNNNFEIIPDSNNNKSIPSIVSFSKTNRYVGQEAKNMMLLNSENTIYEVKRLIGRKYSDETVKNDQFFLSYNIEEGENNNINICVNNKIYKPEEISSIILMELKNMAQSYLKKNITKVVITVPAYFNDSQRQATKDSALIAGLDCVRVINEPTAAALAYGLQEISKDRDINVIIYDLGGGTLDVSLLNINDGIFQVLASTGNTHLGGTDFDNRIMGYCISEFKLKYNIANLNNISPLSLQQLRKSTENAKKLLSSLDKVIINVKNFYETYTLNIVLTKEIFENICQDLFILALKPLEDVLHSAEMNIDDIDDIILVGGATRMPTIKNNIKLYFKKEPNTSINPDIVVSVGAAIQGYLLANNDSPFSKNITLLDIIPLSLGIETYGNIMNVIIPRNSVIPCKEEKIFTTDTDFITEVDINIYEGERQLVCDNNLLGVFKLQDIESTYRGVPQINVVFSVDINGIISVSAYENNKNENSKSIVIKNNKNRLSSEEINKLIDEAIKMEILDNIERKKRELMHKINELCFNVKFNIEMEEYKFIECDKNKMIDDINAIVSLDKNLEIEELKKIKKDIKKKFGLLTFKKVKNEMGVINNSFGESLFNSDIDNTNIDKVDLEENTNKNREVLIQLCNDTLEILASKENIELQNIIEDTILWIYVKENITNEDYIEKITNINNLFENLNKENIINTKNELIIKKNNLEQLCYNVLSVIISNNYSAHEVQTTIIKNMIMSILDKLIDINDNTENNITIIETLENNIHTECNKLYELIINQK